MKHTTISLLFLLLIMRMNAQDTPQTGIRIVDSLSMQEKSNRNTVLLRFELDSLVAMHGQPGPVQSRTESQVPVEKNDVRTWFYVFIGVIMSGLLFVLYLLFTRHKKLHRVIYALQKQVQHLEAAAYNSDSISEGQGRTKSRLSVPALEKKVESLTNELIRAMKDNQALEAELEKANHVRMEFESVKQQLMEVYKIRNYPGFNKEKTETEIVKSMLETERSVALYAYEHFLRPIMDIADSNKNSPARIDTVEREKMLELLISLALLYSEYLYLRIGDLSVGGKIVERLGSLKNGNLVDPATLKDLSTEHGSRALVMRLALDHTSIRHLSYPVFDETNLNLT